MKFKNILMTVVFALLVGGFSIACVLKPADIMSESERRELALFPKIDVESVLDASFMKDFEAYSTDQIPMRDFFRGIKAGFVLNVLNKMDNNSLFETEGHLSKIEYPQNNAMMEHAAERFNYIYETYLKDKGMSIYFSIVPDKNCYISQENGYLAIDYDKFIDDFRLMCPIGEYIDIKDMLDKDDYYFTDTHWKMENITHIAEYIAGKMGVEINDEYKQNILDKPFYGVYRGQSALDVKPDEIKYLTNEIIDNFTVTYYDTGMPKGGDVYNMEKAYGKDPYEMFLSGSTPLCVIENENAPNEKELILFRDSFGSSFAPLIAQGYKKTTVVDIRYVQSDYLDSFIDFENQDVLFLYSTMLLNNSMALR